MPTMHMLYSGQIGKPGGIAQFLPQNEQGRILFTTRSWDIAVDMMGRGQDVVALEEMSIEDARALILQLLINKNQLQLNNLVDELLQNKSVP